jgi:hypothetical protein
MDDRVRQAGPQRREVGAVEVEMEIVVHGSRAAEVGYLLTGRPALHRKEGKRSDTFLTSLRHASPSQPMTLPPSTFKVCAVM